MKNLKLITLALLTLILTSCGYREVGTQGIIQVKRVHKITPILCSDYFVLDASLGIISGGAGSMSTQDIDLTVSADQAEEILKLLNQGVSIMDITYSNRRVSFCQENRILTGFKVLATKTAGPVPVEDAKPTAAKETSVAEIKVYMKCINLSKSVSEIETCQKYK